MWDVIRELVADGVTLLLTTQYLDEADELADRIVVIDHGRVVADGTPRELKSQDRRRPPEVSLMQFPMFGCRDHAGAAALRSSGRLP